MCESWGRDERGSMPSAGPQPLLRTWECRFASAHTHMLSGHPCPMRMRGRQCTPAHLRICFVRQSLAPHAVLPRGFWLDLILLANGLCGYLYQESNHAKGISTKLLPCLPIRTAERTWLGACYGSSLSRGHVWLRTAMPAVGRGLPCFPTCGALLCPRDTFILSSSTAIHRYCV